KSPMVPNGERPVYLRSDFLTRLEPLEPLRFLPELKSRTIRMQFVEGHGELTEVVHNIEAAAPATATVTNYPSEASFRSAVSDGRLFEWISAQVHSKNKIAKESAEVLQQKEPAR